MRAELRHALPMALWLVCCCHVRFRTAVPGLGCHGGCRGDSCGGGGFGGWWASDPEHAKLQGITGVVLDDSTVI